MTLRLVSGVLLAMALMSCGSENSEEQSITPQQSVKTIIDINHMAVDVSRIENRPVSFTNKRSAYYYTQTHANNHPEHTWFAGFNVGQKRLFAGYQLFVDGKALDNQSAQVTVFPHKLIRRHQGVVEKLQLFDEQDIVRIELSGDARNVGITLTGDQIQTVSTTEHFVIYQSKEDPDKVIAIAPLNEATLDIQQGQLTTSTAASGFYILVANSQVELESMLTQVRAHDNDWLAQRKQRMENLLIENTQLTSPTTELVQAMRWITLNMDQLMTKQRGHGIYAGLPWFNEYWGRDNFIALPGASLVSGQFEWARNIITSFAEFQDNDPNSPFFGRVPNIVKVGEVDYHTTDGTPRFIIQMQEYVKYSGDKSLISEMYPVVKNSIEGSLKNWVDEKGYLLHKNNETWMDAREQVTLKSYSPRGSRANDIQALWYQQILAGVYFAQFVGDKKSEEKWHAVAEKLKHHFQQDFVVEDVDHLVDRLSENDEQDLKLRPNQLFALDLIDSELTRARATKAVWQHTVYPWGVASLDNRDEFFHPFHLQWENYHKDQAYHNGTVWLWNNGIAMQRMIEAGQTEVAYQLFENMNMFALKRGVVGGLAENSNAYPRAGETWPTLTGTYLQAWSNSEHLRVWYQHFLGIRPDLIKHEVTLAPRVPTALKEFSQSAIIGDGRLVMSYRAESHAKHYSFMFEAFETNVKLDVEGYDVQTLAVKAGDSLSVKVNENAMSVNHISSSGNVIENLTVSVSEDKLKALSLLRKTMADVTFARPLPLENYRVLTTHFERQ